MPVEKGLPYFDYNTCMACGICVQACPFSCLGLSKDSFDPLHNVYPQLKPEHGCTGCSLCAKACPVDCIDVHA